MKKLVGLLLVAGVLGTAVPAVAGVHHHRHHGPRIGIGIGISHGWGYYGGYYRPWGYYPGWWDGPYGYPVAVYPRGAMNYGALDTDISPERAEVWVDGEKVGVADDFDGFPDFLWLEKGAHDVVFYAPGHKTLARQYSIYGGQVIDVEDRLEPGEAVLPQDLVSPSHERRDARLQRDRELREEVERSEARREDAAVSAEEPLDARGEPGRLRLRVRPDEASVYLDGRFLGTGRELARLRSGLIVDSGEHDLQVVYPGHDEQTRSFTVESGKEVELEVDLGGE